MEQPILYDLNTLNDFCIDVLTKAGVKLEEAEIISETLLFAELRNIKSHGIVRLPTYVKRLENSAVNQNAEMRFLENKAAAVSVLDADNGMGQVAGYKAMKAAIDMARIYGIGLVAVKNSNHFGVASYFSMLASKEDMIGLVMTNASPAIAPFGTKTPLLGTNPLTVAVPLYIFVGAVIGLIMGALPGLTVTMTIVLVVSLTFGWEMVPALAFIIGAFAGGVIGGSISAIALNIPGTAAAVSTVFDGYPLKLKGEANNALGISLFVSLIGGIFGLIILGFVGALLGEIALKFGPQEYFLITMWGITLVAVLSQGRMTKGLVAAFIGVFVGMIGMDPITGLMRFTFGTRVLSGGVNYIAAMIGLFGMKEVFVQLKKSKTLNIDETYSIRDLFPKFKILKTLIPTMTWSAVIGWIIGLLPGTGGDIGLLVAYGATKSIVKNPSRPFGQGAYEGIAAPETANDAAIGGALTTMLTFGYTW